jgi:YVTN family beta-propeller protein
MTMSLARLFASRSGSFACNTGRLRSCVLQAWVAVVALCVGLIAFTPIAGAQTVVGNLAAGSNPYAVAVNPVTNTVYVANYGSGTVTVINGANNGITSVTVGS